MEWKWYCRVVRINEIRSLVPVYFQLTDGQRLRFSQLDKQISSRWNNITVDVGGDSTRWKSSVVNADATFCRIRWFCSRRFDICQANVELFESFRPAVCSVCDSNTSNCCFLSKINCPPRWCFIWKCMCTATLEKVSIYISIDRIIRWAWHSLPRLMFANVRWTLHSDLFQSQIDVVSVDCTSTFTTVYHGRFCTGITFTQFMLFSFRVIAWELSTENSQQNESPK